MFAEELRLAESMRDDPSAWERVYSRLQRGLRLVAPDGHEVSEFVLHIDGDEAWWRWSDGPFETPGEAG